ncbi:hypothetical protein TH53_09155 [Pedobacter lusitanus]|uniref:DUF6268 domain-containing protein n=1 Tax=Pedobacter lusitanus TaxID=1503925 RepID=A0A0D0F754_9SPHI|nr:DUF6268 family outer membrane beta-barrel protein [Pedobacter lusitanus]KIO77438.1 hypothetical protein TH53_09155 [Pedobacter lusitanus]
MFKKIQPLKNSLVLLLLLTGTSVYAQFSPVNTIDINTIYVPETKYQQKDGNVQNAEKTQKRIDLGYSFLISDKFDPVTKKVSRWTGMIDGSYTQLSKKASDKDMTPERLFSSTLGVSHFHTLKNNWSMVGLLSAGINSDLKKIDYHDLYINGGVLFIKTPHPGFSYGFGGFVMNALNAPILLPGLMLHFQTEGKFKFNIDVPTEVSTAYDLTKKMELKLAVRFRNTSFDTENNADPKRRYLNYMELPAGLEAKWKSKHFDFVLGGGYMILRNFDLKESGIKNLFSEPQINKLGGNMFVTAGIRYRLKPISK